VGKIYRTTQISENSARYMPELAQVKLGTKNADIVTKLTTAALVEKSHQ